MKLLILKGFNNYFNRKVKKYSDLAAYIGNSEVNLTYDDINFNPNDGITTTIVLGNEDQLDENGELLNWEFDGSPDYIVAYTEEIIPNPDPDEEDITVVHIHSRWFVLECVRTRAGQYKLALKRDVIADYLNQVLNSHCYVEKGYVTTDNPLIFNEEGVSLNQIKKSEKMLTDDTEMPWLVMYIAKNFPASDTPDVDANGNLPVEGKMVLDTSTALDYDDLPWANLETPPGTGIDTSFKRYIKGAGEMVLSPIIGSNIDIIGTGEADHAINECVRLNLNFYIDQEHWYVDRNTTKTVRVQGKSIDVPDFSQFFQPHRFHVLTRGEIDLTPTSRTIYWNTTSGGRITSYNNKNTNFYQNEGKDWNQAFNAAAVLYNKFINNYSNVPLNIRTYLSNKSTTLESLTTYDTTSRGREYRGGNQMFLPAANILYYNNRIIKTGVNYYRVKVTRKEYVRTNIDYFEPDGDGYPTPSSTNSLAISILGTSNLPHNYELNGNNEMVETWADNAWFEIEYERVQGDLLRFTVPKPTDRLQLNDAAFDMICFPYGAIQFVIPNDGNTQDLPAITSTKEASIGMARSIASKLGSAMYDLQLLPYCPYREVVETYLDDGYVNLGLTSPFPYSCWSGIYKINTPGDTPSRSDARSFGLWCYRSHDSFNIEYDIEIPDGTDPFEYKLFNACKKYRLVSPNYSSVFEFNPLKNRGVTIFNVDYNYRPFNPYIHIAPFFNDEGLYGPDTNDNRGLILQGDFSVGYYSDKWAEYQINNANYADIFNRQIQNLDFNQKLERDQTRWNYGVNIASEWLGLGGGVKGAAAGGSSGTWQGAVIGAVAGTVVGGVSSIIGGANDEAWMKSQQRENKSYAIDMYNLNLGNVKALPYGLAKSDALTENFKFFPFIEEYDCTDIEKSIFRTKLFYDGMTVGAIDYLNAYLPTEDADYWMKISGRMIFIDQLADDFQIANEIYNEVLKGFYYRTTYVDEGE